MFAPSISADAFDSVQNPLSYNHTERRASASSEASDLCNGSGTHLERQVKHHHRLALVMLPLPLTLTLDAWCGYTLRILTLALMLTFVRCE